LGNSAFTSFIKQIEYGQKKKKKSSKIRENAGTETIAGVNRERRQRRMSRRPLLMPAEKPSPSLTEDADKSRYAGINKGCRCMLLCWRSLSTPTMVSVPASIVAAGESTFPGVWIKRRPCYSHHQRPLKTPVKTFADSIISGGKN
jgi:hypothetical protein